MSENPFILYVEDDPTSREVMEMTLMYRMGCSSFQVFEDSENFISKVKSLPQKPDVIFLDIHMKPYDGFQMLQMLRNEPDYAQAKIIALTASVMNEEVAALETAGFDGTIAKPIDADAFPNLLNRIISGERVWFIV
ncbi:MAG: response regulator [Anaerolineae bacterium]|nr:response regulator [Anaerolineae bacterium]